MALESGKPGTTQECYARGKDQCSPDCTGLREQVIYWLLGAEAEPFFRRAFSGGGDSRFCSCSGEIRQNITLIGLGLNKPLSGAGPRSAMSWQPWRKRLSLAGQSLMVIRSGSLLPGVPEGIYGRLIHRIRGRFHAILIHLALCGLLRRDRSWSSQSSLS